MQVDLIGVGSPIVDILTRVDDSFIAEIEGEKGGMVLVDDEKMQSLLKQIPEEKHTSPGGSAGNTTFAAAHLGVKTAFLGKIGNNDAADFFRKELLAAGGKDIHLKVGKLANGQCLSMVTPDSQRTMRTNLGAAMTLSPDEISVEDFKDCKMAHIEGYLLFNPSLIHKVLDSAKAAGCKISLDLASFEVVGAAKSDLPEILKKYVDIVFANEDEAAALLDSRDYEKMAAQLGEWCNIAVVKMGKDGAYIAHNNKVIHTEALVIKETVDTTGAGDLYAAGFLSAHLQGKSLKEAGHQGSRLGAAVVQVMGTQLSATTWQSLRS
jgi:sugar/nucleoside kinase (ribokinase family)